MDCFRAVQPPEPDSRGASSKVRVCVLACALRLVATPDLSADCSLSSDGQSIICVCQTQTPESSKLDQYVRSLESKTRSRQGAVNTSRPSLSQLLKRRDIAHSIMDILAENSPSRSDVRWRVLGLTVNPHLFGLLIVSSIFFLFPCWHIQKRTPQLLAG